MTATTALAIYGAIVATARFLLKSQTDALSAYRACRQDLGRAILLGLEFLVAGDIIRTVVVDPTLDNLLVLAIIVLIRTFLSTTLQLEVEGRWPWQHHDVPATKVEQRTAEGGREGLQSYSGGGLARSADLVGDIAAMANGTALPPGSRFL